MEVLIMIWLCIIWFVTGMLTLVLGCIAYNYYKAAKAEAKWERRHGKFNKHKFVYADWEVVEDQD